MKQFLLILVAIVLLEACSQKETVNVDNKNDANPLKEFNQNASNGEFLPLKESYSYKLSSNEENIALGEELEIIYSIGNAYLGKGKYNGVLNFYRLYRKDNEGINIYFETTEEKEDFLIVNKLVEDKNFDEIFELKDNQERFIIKYPYEKGNNWGYGSVIDINKEIKISNKKYSTLVVEDETGNTYYYDKQKGLIKIEYRISDQLSASINKTKVSANILEK